MTDSLLNNKRIAKNTLVLYVRMILTMGVSLYTSRVILDVLGVEDYGIYTVVGGVVLMFSSINTTMAGAVQRFMSFAYGTSNYKKLNSIFNTSVILHIFISIIAFMLLETIGTWFLNSKMNISPSRINAANWVLQFSILTFIANIVSVPYNAVIIANERMKAFAYISIIEVSLKLVIVFSLLFFSTDRLKLYSFLMFIIAIILRIIYGLYAKINFEECKFTWIWQKDIYKEMISFAGWNLIGVTSTLVRTQGVNIIINIFFGAILNASIGIANQVKIAVENFTNNFLTALSPQIIKSYASENYEYLMDIVFKGSRYAFYLLYIISIPIIMETEFILKVWLKKVPDYTIIFVKLTLMLSIIESLSKTLIQLMFATGEIKNYQLIVGSITLLNLPIIALAYFNGYPPYYAMVVGIVIAILALVARLIMLNKMVNLSIKLYCKKVLINSIIVGCISLILPTFVINQMDQSIFRFITISSLCIFSTITSIYFVGLSQKERYFIKNTIANYLISNRKNK